MNWRSRRGRWHHWVRGRRTQGRAQVIRASSSAALVIALGAALWAGTAAAKMPPPTPEEQAAAQQRRAQEQAQLEREKAALERVQDQVVARYRREQPNASAPDGGGRTEDKNMPYRARELPGSAGPHGSDKQSAEAHSAPAK
jgi:acyl-CoA synthetase (AMP-forming)/AMP-acid ligase II